VHQVNIFHQYNEKPLFISAGSAKEKVLRKEKLNNKELSGKNKKLEAK
jgi:hypothetical protein